MRHHPRVSIGLPVYNGAQHVAQTLDSLLGQEFEEFEVIVSDNASTDETQDICEAYARRDRRIRYYRSQRNLGAATNYNRAFGLAVGEYFKWAPHDDMYAPQYLRLCVEALDHSDCRVVLAYPRTLLIDAEGDVVGKHEDGLDTRGMKPVSRLARMLSNPASWCHPVVGVIRTEVLRSTRLIGSYGGSDQTLMAELALRGEFYEIPERLFLRRVHQGESPSLKANATSEELATWFDIRNHDRVALPWTQILWEHVQAIWLAPLLWHEKVACLRLLKTAPFATHWQRATVSREVTRAIREAAAKRAIQAIRLNSGNYWPHRVWALWDGFKYRRWDWVRVAFAYPSIRTRAALLAFVAAQLQRRQDRVSRELLKQWRDGHCRQCRVATRLVTMRRPVVKTAARQAV